ncbi:hypothetical protein F4679DRAFT_392349 [Xylaria curta]|nr:hypothetical protein F4679DRAFT_392349 [Xylaria curta]
MLYYLTSQLEFPRSRNAAPHPSFPFASFSSCPAFKCLKGASGRCGNHASGITPCFLRCPFIYTTNLRTTLSDCPSASPPCHQSNILRAPYFHPTIPPYDVSSTLPPYRHLIPPYYTTTDLCSIHHYVCTTQCRYSIFTAPSHPPPSTLRPIGCIIHPTPYTLLKLTYKNGTGHVYISPARQNPQSIKSHKPRHKSQTTAQN